MKYIKGSLLIIFVAMCVFFSIDKVEAKNSTTSSCDGKDCSKVCEYNFKYEHKSGTITIYGYSNSKLSISFYNKDEGYVNFGPDTINNMYKTKSNVVWKSKIETRCPTYAYIDLSKFAFGLSDFNAVCFDNDNSSCAKASKIGTTFGSKSNLFDSSKKTYDALSEANKIIDEVNNKLKNNSMDDVTCDELKDSKFDAKKYVENTFNNDIITRVEKEVFKNKKIPTVVLDFINSKNSTLQQAVQVAKNKKDRECIKKIDEDPNLSQEEKDAQKKAYADGSGQQDFFSAAGEYFGDITRKYVQEFPTEFEDLSCDTLLGDKTKDGDEAPIYWIDLGFNVIKYIAIIALIVLSTIDFMKAVVAQDNDALQKAIRTTVKRLIFAVMIFFLPILVDFVLEVLEISGSCNV